MIANRPRRAFFREGLLWLTALSLLTLRCGKFATDEPQPPLASAEGGAPEAAAGSGGKSPETAAGTGSSTGGQGGQAGEAESTASGAGGGEGGGAGAEPEPRADALVLRPERSLLISDPAVLEGLTLERVLWSLAGVNGHEMYLAFARSFVPRALAEEAAGPRCDDEAAVEAGASSLNGFPIPCPAEAEALLHSNENKVWKPLSVTNRFDLAPEGGENCGEQHLSFYLSRVGALVTASLRFSAVIANPSPELGLEGCRPLVDFWASLSRAEYDRPADRAHALEAAFLGPSLSSRSASAPELQALVAAGYLPFMSPEHFGRRGRLQLLYLGDKGIWHFFEHALVSADEGWVLRRPLTQSLPILALVSQEPSGNPCASQLLASLPGLLDDDPVNQRMNVAPSCFAGTDVTEGPTLLSGLYGWVPEGTYGPTLEKLLERELNMRYPSYGLYPSDVAARADFAGTCNGCHYPKGSPFANPGTIAHVNPQRTEPCGRSGGDEERSCYARSPLLKLSFLPRWTALLQNFWDHPGEFPALPGGATSTLGVDGTQLVQQNP
ncbi:MAG: hypothetical protein EOO73_33365 [Myxococcales bacterium]|nr:MAG: hypothetical protein EOO73_33365 [Myxococcales bacterium]